MNGINTEKLILEKSAFDRKNIEMRMASGDFKSIAKFELFIWDLEMFLQIQKRLGDKVVLKGGAATQFYIPISNQRTSVDIDLVCTASRDVLHETLSSIETELNGKGELCRFKAHEPKNPKFTLDTLETYFLRIPSICSDTELFTSRGIQEIKVEVLFSNHAFPINHIKRPELFALETEREFNLLALECLFADKLTTLGPTTIGITDDRSDEQFKQIYDVFMLFISNVDQILSQKESIRMNYREYAMAECKTRNIPYNEEKLLLDINLIIGRIKAIESSQGAQKLANDFQSLYLRKEANRDKAQWAIAGYILGLLVDYIFRGDGKILHYKDIERLLGRTRFDNMRGPERGRMIEDLRNKLKADYGMLPDLSPDLFKKRLHRIIWELASIVFFEDIDNSIKALIGL